MLGITILFCIITTILQYVLPEANFFSFMQLINYLMFFQLPFALIPIIGKIQKQFSCSLHMNTSIGTICFFNIGFTSNKNIMRQFAIGWFWRMFYILLVVVVITTNIIFIIMKSDCFVKLLGAIIFLLCYLLFCVYLMIDMVLQMDAYPRFNSFLAQSCLGSMFHQNDQQYLLPDDNNHSIED